MITGWIGITILISSYIVSIKNVNLFWTLNGLASVILAIHAYFINDLPFILINIFITCMCIWKILTN